MPNYKYRATALSGKMVRGTMMASDPEALLSELKKKDLFLMDYSQTNRTSFGAKLKPKELMLDWVEYVKGLCMENEMIAHQVRKKGKSLRGCIAVLLAYSFKNQIAVDKAIIKAAKISASRVTFGIPGMAKAKELIRDYYLGGSRK